MLEFPQIASNSKVVLLGSYKTANAISMSRITVAETIIELSIHHSIWLQGFIK